MKYRVKATFYTGSKNYVISFMGTGIKQKISATAYCKKTFVRFRVLYLVVTKP